uniref:SGNH hydrolase-type esterase domain-containing protein n=1 Tax=Oryzias melastigma TaxID=30732 RepID=A0A3B3CP93_ORYME
MEFPALRRDATEIPTEHGRTVAGSNPARAPRISAKALSAPDTHRQLELPPSSRSATSSSRRRILKEAVRFHSSGLRASPPSQMADQLGGEAAAAVAAQVRSVADTPVSASPAPASPPPLCAPTTAIIGDSIIRNALFPRRDSSGHPGETPRPAALLPFLCEETDFTRRFSRLLSLSTWLQSASRQNGFLFIDNFNLFWNRPSFYRPDGIHPSPLGSEVLAANIRHSLLHLKLKI